MNRRNREEGGMNAPGPEKKIIHTPRIFSFNKYIPLGHKELGHNNWYNIFSMKTLVILASSL